METGSRDRCDCYDCRSGALSRCDRQAEEFLAEPAAIYTESRRTFFRRLLVGGVTAATLTRMADEAEAGQFFTPSVSDQKKMGAQAAQQILQKYPEVHDTRAGLFKEIGRRLVNALPAADQNIWDYQFHVIESPTINAFALPGGNMFLFTGLMDRMKSNDEIAAVTGHEMTHVRKQHWAKAYAGQQKRALGIAVLLKVTKASKTWQEIAGTGDQLYSLKFSRSEEDQADAGGLQDMVDAGYDPRGMLVLFRTLQAASGKSGGPAFLSDHPLTSERIKHTQQRIDALKGRRG